MHCYIFNPIDLKIGIVLCFDILHLDACFQVDRNKYVKNAMHCYIFYPIDLKNGIRTSLYIRHHLANLQIDRIKNVATHSILRVSLVPWVVANGVYGKRQRASLAVNK